MLKNNDFSPALQEEEGIQAGKKTGKKNPKKEKCQAEEKLQAGEKPQANRKYRTEKLLKSSHLSGYQPDFARVVLTEPAYSVAEAKDALDRALRGGK